MKPFLSDKVTCNQITLIDNDKIVKNDDDTSKVLNTFFSNIVSGTRFKSDSKI